MMGGMGRGFGMGRGMPMPNPNMGGYGGMGRGMPACPPAQMGGMGGLPRPNAKPMGGGGGGGDAQPPMSPSKDNAYWECHSCTFVNSIMSASCEICSNPQPKGKKPPPGPPPNNVQGPPPGPPPKQFNAPKQSAEEKSPSNSFPPGPQGGGMPPPPPPDARNNGNAEMQLQPMPDSVSGALAEDPDEATARLIAQMMQAELCVQCKEAQGYEMSCQHKMCGKCAKLYLLRGIATARWKKEPLRCPVADCADGVIPLWLVRESGLSADMRAKLEDMQNAQMIAADPTMTSCPKCKETYSTEAGDISAEVSNKVEKGLDGQLLSYAHKQHKARYRFRCPKSSCKAVFCSGCGVEPYHIGYTCAEYKKYLSSAKCRFCEKTITAENQAQKDFTLKSGLDNVCNAPECLEKRRWSCDLKHPCGHNCIGLMGHECIPCLDPECCPPSADVTDEDFCNICWVDPLRAAPCVELECGHFFHFMCLWQKIDRKWPAVRITFGFLNCPLCKQEIHHPALDDITNKYYSLKAEIQKDAVERVKIEGLHNDKRLTAPDSPYYNNLPKFAMDRLAFYPCSKCKKPYFGGMKACEEAGLEQAENYKQEHLVCGSCASGPNAKSCKKHGKKYITYKCKFCCSVSSWYCWGSTHFCDACHKKQEQGTYLNRMAISELPKCPGKELCPLGVEHPANGTAEFSLGCVVCLRK